MQDRRITRVIASGEAGVTPVTLYGEEKHELAGVTMRKKKKKIVELK